MLRPGGGIFAHMMLHRFPPPHRLFSRLARLAYSQFVRLSAIKASARRGAMRIGGEPYMHGISIDEEVLLDRLQQLGFVEPTIATIRVRANNSTHSCVIASKPD